MRKISWIVLGLMLGVLIGIGATTVFAAGPTDPTTPDNSTWGQMQQACANGDVATMQQLYQQTCGQGWNSGATGAPANGAGATQGWRGGGMMGGWNGGGMMGGWGGGRGMMGGIRY